MRIDGKEIAQEILDELKLRVGKLKEKNIIPHLHIITLTTDHASESYVGQKKKKGEEIGAKITVENLDPRTSTESLLEKIEKLNQDSTVHGIIVQRPFSPQIDEEKIANSINPGKDVDGFHPDSKFSPPIAEAVLRILECIFKSTSEVDEAGTSEVLAWLKTKKIAVVGKGVTAGGPIMKTLGETRSDLVVITSKTKNKQEILKNADIVICAVGKPNVIRKEDLKNGVILVGVGMFRGDDGKFHSDYEEEDIKNIASFYTPTPGGVGPVNVAMLLKNLIIATENQAGLK
ncbi:MAG: bifunctional 5,10-methylenetetrahydrofolate dehydrogenase/5,10-methenyltetrahydrofolate cyclohydrolase [Patescibacteria group bacterium]